MDRWRDVWMMNRKTIDWWIHQYISWNFFLNFISCCCDVISATSLWLSENLLSCHQSWSPWGNISETICCCRLLLRDHRFTSVRRRNWGTDLFTPSQLWEENWSGEEKTWKMFVLDDIRNNWYHVTILRNFWFPVLLCGQSSGKIIHINLK